MLNQTLNHSLLILKLFKFLVVILFSLDNSFTSGLKLIEDVIIVPNIFYPLEYCANSL
jgi:hypothetical protein